MCSTGSTSTPRGMFDVQNIYGTPQVPRKKPCLRPRRMTLIDLRNVPLTEEDGPQRKASSGTVRSEGGLSHYSKTGIWQIHDSTDSLHSSRSSMRTKHASESSQDGSSRFPKLEDCAHFHYDFVDFGPLQVNVCEEDRENFRHNEVEQGENTLLVRVSCNNKAWTVRRTLSHFCSLDRQLHRCIFDRKFSQLPELQAANMDVKNCQEVEQLFQNYLKRFSELAGTMINCGSILNWLEMDNRGNRLLAVDDSGINTPAIAAAHAVKRYNAQAADEISLQVGDIVSVIDMPPAEDTIWWRGKRGFEVGFFPSACVEVIIGDKVPASMVTVMPPTGSLSSSIYGNTLTPLSTPAAARKPCEIDNAEDTASMIRKHGKLMSFLRTFFSTRPPRNQLKQSGIVKERVFGCDLGEHLLNSGHDVPVVLKSCTEVIERYGIVDGIYRLSGISSNIQKLRVAFDEDEVPELMESTYLQDIHSISSLLKMYFRELPNPLLTYQLYDKFAEAVRDEDNRLLRIHDVVQQLPPPHYRTLEYLMRHLGRVASHAFETGMHSKNLAIVWAPNLLRSKELELGGGAAALQGVGIQAVVTECLICYCDLIFNDKMPAYDSSQLNKSQKKPRPKSLAISTPTRLLSLEEARERAFLSSLAHSNRFIDVGGGPASLPSTYHTVIDLPGYRKKSNKNGSKGKKSPASGGWKSIFSKPRSGSVKKHRKGSVQGEDKPVDGVQTKALTEEDVHNWKHRLRNSKSAESLLSMATSARSSISSQASSSMSYADGRRHREELLSPYHKRSLSDASAVLHHYPHTTAPLGLLASSSHQTPVGVKPENVVSGRYHSRMDPSRKQTFVRGDSTRTALHRRTPSAPNTPRLDRNPSTNTSVSASPHKASSQPHLDSISPSPNSDSSFLGSPADTSLGIDIDAAIKARLQQMALQSRSGRSTDSSPKSPEKKSHGRGGVEKKRKGEVINGSIESQDGSSAAQNLTSPDKQKFFVSRYHDYAEILSDEEGGKDVSGPSSTTDMQELVEKLDSKLSSTTTKFYLPQTEEMAEPEAKHAKLEPDKPDPDKVMRASRRLIQRVAANSKLEATPTTQVARRKAEFIPAERSDQARTATELSEVQQTRFGDVSEAGLPPIPRSRDRHVVQSTGASQEGSMARCSSVPLDITQSSENVDISQGDLASMALSELSQSINSFCTSAQEGSPLREDPRWRRSASSDSFEMDSCMYQTLRSFNKEIDSTFHKKVERAIQLEEEGYSRHGESDSSSLSPLHISEDNLAMPCAADTASEVQRDLSKSVSPAVMEAASASAARRNVPEAMPRSVSDSRNVGREEQDVYMSHSFPVPGMDRGDYATVGEREKWTKPVSCVNRHPEYPDYAVIVKRRNVSREERGPGFYSGQGVSVDQLSQPASSPRMQSSPQLRNSASETGSADLPQYGSGVEGCMDSPPLFVHAPHPSLPGTELWPEPEPRLHRGRLRSDTSSPRSDASMPRSHASSVQSNISGSDIRQDALSQSDVSSGVCVVKRQNSPSSSDSNSSSDADDNSDDSIEIVHHAQPVDVQFAMKLSRKQRAAENMACQRGAFGDPPLHTVERHDSRKTSDPVLWKQSPLFGKAVEGRDSRGADSVGPRGPAHPSQVYYKTATVREQGERTDSYGSSQGSVHGDCSFQQSSPVSPGRSNTTGRSCDGRPRGFSNPTELKADLSSPGQRMLPYEGRPRAASHSDGSWKFQREDLPIISGNLPSSPASQRSHIPSPRSPTLCSPPPSPHSRLPSPRSPIISATSPQSPSHRSPVISSPSLSQKSRIPSLQSPTSTGPGSPQLAPNPPQSLAGPAVPLHLMLYHPDEFQVPLAAVGSGVTSGISQPVPKSDAVVEEVSVRKVSRSRGTETPLQGEGGVGPVQQTWQGRPSSSVVQGCEFEGGMQLGKAEQDSMEVDNLCNRLVDELHSVHSHPGAFDPEDNSQNAAPAARGSVQVEAVVKRCVEETEVGGEAIVEQRLVRVESFGEVQDEEMENALNVGKEMLLSHSSSLASTPTTSSAATSTTMVSSSGLAQSQTHSRPLQERRASASKIPRFHKRTDSREDKNVISEGDASPHSPFHRRTSSREEKTFVSESWQGEAAPHPRLQKRSNSREEKAVAMSVSHTDTAQHSRLHKRSNSQEEKAVQGDANHGDSAPYSSHIRRRSNSGEDKGTPHHRRTVGREEKSGVSDSSQREARQHPPLHRRTNSREEKVVSDVTAVNVSSPHSRGSRFTEGGRAGSNPRSKEDQNKVGATRTSKIPLSQKIPSPTGSARDSKVPKSTTSPNNPRPTGPPGNKSHIQGKGPVGPVPRTRTSIHKSDHVSPPADEVMEVARPSVKKRTSLNQKGERGSAAGKETKGNKSVIVQEFKTDKGDAKLVIEKQPTLKKKIQTVHARKVPHPPRQIAEALDVDAGDSPSTEVSSTGPSDMEHSEMSSQEDEVFSDESCRLAGRRDRSYSSSLGMGSPWSARRLPSASPLLHQRSDTYNQMAASRSSLDDSSLQLAAERHDNLAWGTGDGEGYNTGSLRMRQSKKMRHLVEVFERGGSSHSGEESGDTKKRDRSDSTSGSTTISLGSQEKELDTDDDIFRPPRSPCLPPSVASRRSRSRDRGGSRGRGSENLTSPHRRASQSPTARRMSAGRGDDAVLRHRRPSPASRGGMEERPRPLNRIESGGNLGRPPKYRSASRGRTYSDSSTSESDNTQQYDSRQFLTDSPGRPHAVPHGRANWQDEGVYVRSGRLEKNRRESGGEQEADEDSKRRGSIKELRQLFEQSSGDERKDSGSEVSPPIPVRRASRPRSVSPGADSSSPAVTPNIMRRSLEIPQSSTVVKQPLRLGPKPFYGSKK